MDRRQWGWIQIRKGHRNMYEILPSKTLKSMLPFAALPLLMAAVYFSQAGRANNFILLNYEIIVIFSYIAAVGDIKTKHIPNSLILAMLGVWVCVTAFHMIVDIESAIPLAVDSLLGFAVSGVIFLIVYIISRKGVGGGDVKFMAAAGLYIGVGGSLPAIFIGTTLAAVVGLALIVFKKIGRKDTLPLVPFLFAGILATILA